MQFISDRFNVFVADSDKGIKAFDFSSDADTTQVLTNTIYSASMIKFAPNQLYMVLID